MTKPLSHSELDTKCPSHRVQYESHPSGQMTRQAHELQRNFMRTKTVSREELEKMYPSPKSLSDEGILHGELYLDKAGKAHFICHTPGNMTFVEVREALSKFIDLFLDQIERQEECPIYEKASEG